jgi:hypothetical protein
MLACLNSGISRHDLGYLHCARLVALRHLGTLGMTLLLGWLFLTLTIGVSAGYCVDRILRKGHL